MGTDFRVVVFDLDLGAVVVDRWMGQRGTLERAREVLSRPADHVALGTENWGRVRPEQVVAIAEASYVGGPKPDEVAAWAADFGGSRYIWGLLRDH